jgi:predicted dehydrogenase
MTPIRLAVIGTGAFGKNHLRVIHENTNAILTAAVDIDPARAAEAAARYDCEALTAWRDLPGKADAAIVATPTVTHAEIAAGLMEAGLDVLIEKPIAASAAEARSLIAAAARHGRILQVGHLERFNPAILALDGVVTLPLFFEIHRMNAFAPRSLDVDVVLDLMIHDIDLVLHLLGGTMPAEIRAAGVRILSEKVDIANVRLAFPNGCVANLTASRVSTERIRKLRLFQPHQYISVDYGRQDGVVISVDERQQVGFRQLSAAAKREPLATQLDSFLHALTHRTPPAVTGEDAARALAVCEEILARIKEHGAVVAHAVAAHEREHGRGS